MTNFPRHDWQPYQDAFRCARCKLFTMATAGGHCYVPRIGDISRDGSTRIEAVNHGAQQFLAATSPDSTNGVTYRWDQYAEFMGLQPPRE